ncbi:MAG: isoleucine--tRNA ligase, partial [Desulfurococcales archaeon]|nr:isoleucine--tRNA ligase [Desulfurococcales archaeon]
MPPISDRLSRVRYDQFALEEWVKRFWAENRIYRLVKEKSRRSQRKFFFLDGPPYASAKSIHVGTAWNKVIKDVVLRYRRMKGYNVWDQPGFDTHGLPIEVKVEKMLGVRNKKEIVEKIGVDRFVEECKKFAQENIEGMTENFKEIGVFMDWDNPYVTYKNEYIESGWWLIKRAWEQGLLYQGRRVVHWCPRCETTLADYEVSEYRDLEDPSIYVKFPVKDRPGESLLIWTTTPWTLPANAFVMAHPDLEYVKVRVNGEVLILAKARLEHVMKEAGVTDYEVIEEFPGRELEGLEYEHPLEDLVPAQKILSKYHRVVLAPEAVTATEGTGLVHSAPGHGEIDFDINAERVGAPVVSLVDNQGRMTEEAGKYKGLYFRTEANQAIMKDLEEKGALFHKTTIVHRYPVCWRCKTPLVLRATDQWFINVSKLKDKLIEEADKVEWVPGWAKSRFMNLLENVRDWVISRQRFWGIPLPVWRCEKCGYTHVVGSVRELVEMGGEEPRDLHRPWVDKVTLRCPKCGGEMKRVPDVLDVWFDSGIAFYASLGYPRNKEPYESMKPVDFIVEGHDQIRGWFFSLLRSGVIGFGEKPYERVLVHGFALDEHGREMHKSLGNYIEFRELIKKIPRDAVRLWSMQNTIWEDLRFQWKAMEQAWRALNIAWNVYAFASTYMSLDKYDPTKETVEDIPGEWLRLEDKWILSRLEALKQEYYQAMETYKLQEAARRLREFIVEDVSHWYIRLIRRRVWEEADTPDKRAAYATLHRILWEWLL